MQVRVLYFGVLRDLLGRVDESVGVDDSTTVSGLLDILRKRTSNHTMDAVLEGQLWRSLAVAVNREYATQDVVLSGGDEVALLPPVSGGACKAWSEDEG